MRVRLNQILITSYHLLVHQVHFISFRTDGELKRLHFNWTDVISVEEGQEEICHSLPPRFQMDAGENRANCFVSVSTKQKGDFMMVFKSEKMRNACLKGFCLLIAKRKNTEDERQATVSSNSEG
jgi:hypothetical protein